ncbi:MAG TPA: capsular biosynthesis protein, partial [Clostridiales bacterium]|nr:capsular biosynthesis protein [Clostridiales bacterium]
KTIAVTSPEPSDGKSTTACNFAISLAQIDKKVLLVECDLRKPKLHRYFGIGNDVGLTHIIADMIFDDQPVMNFVKKIPDIENLSILTAGFTPPNPFEMLSSQKFKNFLDLLKEEFDIIVIDTPPVAQLTDAAIVSKITDGVLLVIASGKTNAQAAISAKQSLLNADANILGVVLTKIDKRSGSYYNYYNYSSYEE